MLQHCENIFMDTTATNTDSPRCVCSWPVRRIAKNLDEEASDVMYTASSAAMALLTSLTAAFAVKTDVVEPSSMVPSR